MRRTIRTAVAVLGLLAGSAGWAPASEVPTWTPVAGGWVSGPVEHVTTIPLEAVGGSDAVVHDGPLYVSSFRSFSIYDVSDPLAPAHLKTVPLLTGDPTTRPASASCASPSRTATTSTTIRNRTSPPQGTYTDGAPPYNRVGCGASGLAPRPGFGPTGGTAAVAFFEHGMRLVRVDAQGGLEEIGGFLPLAGNSTAPKWVTDDVLYVVDLQRGVDVLRIGSD